MYGKKFSPIDVQWMSPDPNGACCMCPDDFRDRGEPVDYCPQHGAKPDFSDCHLSEKDGRRWRAEHGIPITGSNADPR
jgi:hypothetical protein